MDTLYQDRILALAQIARSSPALPHSDLIATINNPLCGDRVTLSVFLDGDLISATHVEVKGCALCEAGAGLLHKIAPGATRSAVKDYGTSLGDWLKDPLHDTPPDGSEALSPVRPIKNRHKCVLLAFDAISALKSG